MALLERDELLKIGPVTVHREEAFADDQHTLEPMAIGGEDGIERGEVIVREQPSRAPGQLGTHDDAVVDQRIVDDEVLRAHQRRERRYGGGMARDIGDAVRRLVVAGERLLEFAMNAPLTRADPAGRKPMCRGRARLAPLPR